MRTGGGNTLVCDLLDDPRYPWFDPPVPEAGQAWSLFYRIPRIFP